MALITIIAITVAQLEQVLFRVICSTNIVVYILLNILFRKFFFVLINGYMSVSHHLCYDKQVC